MRVYFEEFEPEKNDKPVFLSFVRVGPNEVRVLIRGSFNDRRCLIAIDEEDDNILIDPEAAENCGFARVSVNGWEKCGFIE